MPQNAMMVNTALTPDNKQSPVHVNADGALTISAALDPASVTVTLGTVKIATTNTFEALAAADANRLPGGLIANPGTADISVYFGTTKDATAANSILVAAKGTIPLTEVFTANVAYTGNIAVTGTKDQSASYVLLKTA